MTKVITLDGKDYLGEPVLMTSDDCIKLDGQLYALKPIDKPEKQKYRLSIEDKGASTRLAGDVWWLNLELTKLGMEALSEAIKALVECATTPGFDNFDPYLNNLRVSLDKARELISSEEQV